MSMIKRLSAVIKRLQTLGGAETVIVTNMTPEQEKQFDAAFVHFDQAFSEMDRAFASLRTKDQAHAD